MPATVPKEWREFLKEALEGESFRNLSAFLEQERARYAVFPPEEATYRALSFFPPEKTRAVIVGQDPYHERGQAEGLCFSVPDGIRIPPSLRNIRHELALEFGREPAQVSLLPWARQGVLLLNSVLTVREGLAGSHAKRGWEEFTAFLVEKLSRQNRGMVFFLWGNYAKGVAKGICREGHLILESAHPSPLSARAFFGCNHFLKASEFWLERGETPVNWLGN